MCHVRLARLLETLVFRMQVLSVDVGGVVQAGGRTRLVTEEAAGDGTFLGIVKIVVASTGRHRQHFRNDVEIQRREKRQLFVSTVNVIEEGDIVIARIGIGYGRTGSGPNISQTPRGNGRGTRR